MALRAGSGPGIVERAAWAVSSSSRRFFVTVAVVVGASILAASVTAALVSARNAAAVEDAQGRGVQVAASIADLRNHLGLADTEVAAIRVSGDLTTELDRSAYDELRQASLSLTEARLAASGQNARDIATLVEHLDDYATMLDLSWTFPTTYLGLSRKLVQVELVPRADCVRRAAELEVARASDRVTGPPTTVALAGLVLAMLVLLGAATLVAGRTRRYLHPAFALAALLGVAGLEATAGFVVTDGLWTQRGELQAASQTELDAYAGSNAAAFALFDLRTYEMDAVASQDDESFYYEEFHCRMDPAPSLDGDELLAREDTKAFYYEEFRGNAEELVGILDGSDGDTLGTLPSAVHAYVESVNEVERLGGEGDHEAAADETLQGDSAVDYGLARQRAASTVRSTSGLTARLDAADHADVSPLVPLLLGGASAVLAMAGVLLRGRGYW